jgi:hypothetical protein
MFGLSLASNLHVYLRSVFQHPIHHKSRYESLQRRALSLSSRRLVEWNHRPDEPISEGLAKASGTETTETDDPIRQTEDVLAQLARAAPKDDNDVAVPAWNSDDGVSRDMVKEAESSTQAWLQSVLQLKE